MHGTQVYLQDYIHNLHYVLLADADCCSCACEYTQLTFNGSLSSVFGALYTSLKP